jgi:dTMP kinase
MLQTAKQFKILMAETGAAMFFSFDGVDGVGKTTQMDLFRRWLRETGREAVFCRDPGGTPLGEKIRHLLLTVDPHTPIGRRSEMLLYMAARAQLVEQVIRPALADGKIVVSDRYLLANAVYQGHAGGLDIDAIWRVGRIATDGLEPDLTFLLDMSHDAATARIARAPDRMELQGEEFRGRLRAGFLAEAARRPNIVVIDADRPVEEVHADIRARAETILK